MRKIINNLVLFSLVLVIGFVFIKSVSAQVTDKNVDNKPPDYEYFVGRKVAFSLRGQWGKCSMLIGTIREISDSQITFSIKERLLGRKLDKDTIELSYRKTPLDFDFRYGVFSSWVFIDAENVKEGNELLFFLCEGNGESRRYAFSTTDKSLFPSIRKSVLHFMSYKQNPEILLEIPGMVKASSDMTFIGYLVEFVSGAGAITYSDYTVLVLSQLLENDKLPDVSMSDITYQLWNLVGGSFVFPITSSTRDTALKNIVKVASSNKKFAGQAVIILVRIADKNTVDLKPYLNQQTKIILLEKLQTLSEKRISQTEREKFAKLLREN